MQNTNFRNITKSLINILVSTFGNTWRQRSFCLISLLVGYYIANNLVYYLGISPQRPLGILLLIILIELLIRLRGRTSTDLSNYFWKITDNFRIGFLYSIILEAYKLGS
tara:strand:+ start:1238 stop:1564 length:327 start_codon:yes stop_codon:yes gene_type:complete